MKKPSLKKLLLASRPRFKIVVPKRGKLKLPRASKIYQLNSRSLLRLNWRHSSPQGSHR